MCTDPAMPARSIVHAWLKRNAVFSDQYARACEERADKLAEEVIAISDDASEDPQRSRLRMDARRWYAGKLAPKKYGDRITHAGDEDAPLREVKSITIVSVRPGDTSPT